MKTQMVLDSYKIKLREDLIQVGSRSKIDCVSMFNNILSLWTEDETEILLKHLANPRIHPLSTRYEYVDAIHSEEALPSEFLDILIGSLYKIETNIFRDNGLLIDLEGLKSFKLNDTVEVMAEQGMIMFERTPMELDMKGLETIVQIVYILMEHGQIARIWSGKDIFELTKTSEIQSIAKVKVEETRIMRSFPCLTV